MPLAVELLALLLYGPAIVLLHEAGHAALARTGGYRVTSFGIGLGPPLWRVLLSRGVVFHVDRWVLAGGACVAIPLGPTTARRAWFHAGGLLFQAVLAIVLLALPQAWWVARVAQFNVLVALTNAIPWRFGGAASDGWYLLDVARGGRRGGEILPQRQQLLRLASREAAIGSPVGTMYANLCLAWADVLSDRTEAAADFFTSDPPEAVVEPWLDALYHYVLAELHRLEGRPLAAAHAARDTRAALGDDLSETADGLLSLAEARALVALDAAGQAEQVLARITGQSGPIGRQASAIRLRALLEVGGDELEYATWRVTRRVHEAWLDPLDVVSVLWSASERLQLDGRIGTASGARQAAADLAKRVVSSASPEDRPHLQKRLDQAIVAAANPTGVEA